MYLCSRCGGRAVATAVLRKEAPPAFVRKLRMAAYGRKNAQGRSCPHCDRPMSVAAMGRLDRPLVLDVCPRCHVVWFDPKEFVQVPRVPDPDMVGRRPAALAPAQAGPAADTAVAEDPSSPDSAWKYLPGILGWPVEMRSIPLVRRPAVTWALSLIMALLTVVLLADGKLNAAIAQWGFIPDQWGRHGGQTIFTSFLLHAGLYHLVSNLYFFLVFGDNVEDHLGRGRFLLLLLGAHAAGLSLHAALDPRGATPIVGASAGISGVIAYYALAFPHARLGFFIWFFLRWLRMPAYVGLILYLLVQLVGAWQQVSGASHVSYLAHLGGLAVGVTAALLTRAKTAKAAA